MAPYDAIITPGKSLSIFTLGQTLYEITTRLKAEPKVYTKQDLTFSQEAAATNPIILSLPAQGIRLRFDGPEQRLRLIEVTDFSKNKLLYKDQDVLPKLSTDSPQRIGAATGPTFKHIYSKVFGPTFPGEHLPTSDRYGIYTLSYPGIAFNFPIQSSAWNPNKDFASILSSPATLPATSLAIFAGPNWPDARRTLFTSELEDPKLDSPNSKDKLVYPDEISMVHILGGGTMRVEKAYNQGHFYIQLGETTPQELVAELGPPDMVYRKSDQHLSIHRVRTHSGNSESTTGSRGPEDAAFESHDEDPSLRGGSGTPGDTPNETSEDDEADEESGDESGDENMDDSEDCFYNYFHHGFDILISRPIAPSEAPPSTTQAVHSKEGTPSSSPRSADGRMSEAKNGLKDCITSTSAPLVATKIVLHGNIPGTYAFGRHCRIRWTIPYLLSQDSYDNHALPAITSETPYSVIAQALDEEWKGVEVSEEEQRQRQRGMALNRGWGESVGSSMEVLGNWDDGSRIAGHASHQGRKGHGSVLQGKSGIGSSVLYGWPGLVFEVGKGGVVGGLTVF